MFIGTGNGYLNIYSVKITNKKVKSKSTDLNKSILSTNTNDMEKYFTKAKSESHSNLSSQYNYQNENNYCSSIIHSDLRRFKSEFSITNQNKENSFMNDSSSEKFDSGSKKAGNLPEDSESSSEKSSDNTNSNDWYSADSFMSQMSRVDSKSSKKLTKQISSENHLDSRGAFLLIKKYLTDLNKINTLCNEEDFRESNYSTPDLNW